MTRPTLPALALGSVPLPANPILYGTGNYQASLLSQFNASTTVTQDGNYSLSFYNMPVGSPTSEVYVTDGSSPQLSTLQGVLNANPPPLPTANLIPKYGPQTGGTIQPGGTDGSVLITMGSQMWEFWQFAPAATGSAAANAGYSWQCAQGSYVPDIGLFNGTYPSNYYNTTSSTWGIRGCGLSWMVGMLRAEDYYAGAINHCIAVALPATGNNSGYSGSYYITPAVRGDTNNLLSGTPAVEVPEGSWFTLPSSFNPATWAASNHSGFSVSGSLTAQQIVQMVCTAIQTYGLVVVDTSGNIQFACEDGQTFGLCNGSSPYTPIASSVAPWNPYTPAQVPDWGNFGQNLPWSQMIQIEPFSAWPVGYRIASDSSAYYRLT